MDVLRWWFTLKYDALVASAQRDAFEIRGQGVQVLSENELLTQTGQQVHTGRSDALNQQFAHNFTKDFAALAAKYPLYADLRNIFDLALVAELLRTEGLPEQVGWYPTSFYDNSELPTAVENVPQAVDTVINHRIVQRTNIIAAVSGGVHVDPRTVVKRDKIQSETRGQLNSERERVGAHGCSTPQLVVGLDQRVNRNKRGCNNASPFLLPTAALRRVELDPRRVPQHSTFRRAADKRIRPAPAVRTMRRRQRRAAREALRSTCRRIR